MDFSLYDLGVLYGDGSFNYKGRKVSYLFSTTHKEIATHLEKKCRKNNISINRYKREHRDEKENWETLEIINIVDKEFLEFLEMINLNHENPMKRIVNHPDFIRGYLETKATFFKYESRGIKRWRCAVSGVKEDLETILDYLSDILSPRSIVRRKEREEIGIISKSFRFSINKTEELSNLIQYIEPKKENEKEISLYLSDKIKEFKDYKKTENIGMNRVFKHYKYATKAMGKALGIEIKGIRGGTKAGSKAKPIYLWEEGVKRKEFLGWEQAYDEVAEMFKKKTGKTPPVVDEKKDEKNIK